MLKKLNQLKNREHGFTIIEVLIVLAIAGLILLIIFLAVPALQRASRNTSRKNDVAAIASAVSNYVDNNGGTMPNQVQTGSNSNVIQIGNSSGTGNFESAKTGYYTWPTNVAAGSAVPIGGLSANGVSAITIESITTETDTAVTVVDPGNETSGAVSTESILIVTGVKCNNASNNIDTSPTGTNPRSAVVLYATEAGGKGALQCTEAV